MSPSLTVINSNISTAGTGVPINPGNAFVVGVTDEGPPVGGPAYIACQSIGQYTGAFGPRSSTSSVLYDWLNEFFEDSPSGSVAYVARVTDSSAASATLTLEDSGPEPTVKITALTSGTDGNSIYIAVTVADEDFTITVQDSEDDVLETWGPYSATSALYADADSAYVTFVQSTATGHTTNNPVALSATALSGGADADDLTTASYVSALAQFPAGLGPGTVAIPGQTGSTAWTGLLAHAQANNRFAILDMDDSSVVATIVATVGETGAASNASWGMFIQGSLILPGITPGTTRTVAGSAAVAALRAQVGQQASQNQAPCGYQWPLSYPQGFTEYFGPTGSSSLPTGGFQQSDVDTLEAAGVNVFANYFGVNCLYGFVTPVPKTTDETYWQASASCERMALDYDLGLAAAPFQFKTIDGANQETTALKTALMGVISDHYQADALWGDNASDAGTVNVGPPINTPQTAAAGQLNAQVIVSISPYADAVTIMVGTVPITQAIA